MYFGVQESESEREGDSDEERERDSATVAGRGATIPKIIFSHSYKSTDYVNEHENRLKFKVCQIEAIKKKKTAVRRNGKEINRRREMRDDNITHKYKKKKEITCNAYAYRRVRVRVCVSQAPRRAIVPASDTPIHTRKHAHRPTSALSPAAHAHRIDKPLM